MATWYLYIIQGANTKSLYTGVTTDPNRRLKMHNEGKGAKFTRRGGPWSIVYLEVIGTSQGEALKRERQIKKMSHTQKLALIKG